MNVFYQIGRYDMKIPLEDFNAKIGQDDIFKPTIESESLHEFSKENGVRLVNFATSKSLIIKSTTITTSSSLYVHLNFP